VVWAACRRNWRQILRGILAEPPGAAPEVAFEARNWCEA
jgi:hypothetical protein